jgi:hypothetical protein
MEITGCYTASGICDLLHRDSWEIMDHPAYSPDLLPSVFDPLDHLRSIRLAKRFATDTDVKQAATSWLRTLSFCFLYAAKQGLFLRCDESLNVTIGQLEA